MCAAKSLRKTKSRLPLWGRWTRVSEDGEGNPPAPRTYLSVSPRHRLYQRAAHALGGVTGKLGGNLRGIEDAIKGLGCRLGRR